MARRKKLIRVCAKCGKESKDLVDNLCESCRAESPKKNALERVLKVGWCECGSVSVDDKEVGEVFDVDDLIALVVGSTIEKELKPSGKIEAEVEEIKEREKGTYHVKVRVGQEIMDLVLKIRRVKCERCRYLLGGYYEATIQLRGDASFVDEMVDLCKKIVEKERRMDKKSFITDVENVKGGTDVKIGSKRVAKKIVRHAKKYKPVITKYSKKLKTVKDGKKIYRYTFLIRADENGEKGDKKRK